MGNTDLVVIGGGPGGYVSALRAAQNGSKVILVEKGSLGGTCLNVGCVPTKVLSKTAELYSRTAKLPEMGIVTGPVSLDFAVVQSRRQQVVETLKNGVTQLLDFRQVQCLQGEAGITAPGRVSVRDNHGDTVVLDTAKIIIATGSRPMELPDIQFDGEFILNSTQALEISQVPTSLLVVGAGVIGVEFASIFAQFGTDVTLVELLPEMLPSIDSDVISGLKNELSAAGVKINMSTRVTKVEKGRESVRVTLQNENKTWQVEVEKVLIAAGRKPNAEIGEKLGLTQNGIIPVNEKMETGIKDIYAVGDVTGNYQLAHVAYHEAMVAAGNATGEEKFMDYRCVPQGIFTLPEVAGVGLTEQEAKKKYETKTGIFPFSASGKAMAASDTTGFVKIVAEKRHNEILGAFIIGPSATELIHEVALAIRLEATLDEIADTIHAHPTLSETLGEAALLAMQRPLHFV